MYYRHNLDRYKYPENSDEHMIKVKKVRDITFDDKYPYRPKGFWYSCIRVIYFILVNVIVFPLLRLTHCLKIYGKENIKRNKKMLKNGAITVSNHVFMWDFLCVLKAIRPKLTYFPAWKTNFEGPNGPLIRMSGGIPIPTGSVHAMIKFNKAIESVLNDGKWLHFFPEGSMWFFYPDVRPFKKAVFRYAVNFNKPVIPIGISFRPRKGITKLFTKTPAVDLHIGEPMMPDTTLSRYDAEDKLHRDAYKKVQELCGINEGDPTYNEDQVISHYKKTM